MLDKILDSDLKLCYINNNIAYFTSDLENQWGDDWDNAPYEYNSGTPYQECGCKMLMLAYDCCHTLTPADLANVNSNYSVQDINSKNTPWLVVRKLDGTSAFSLWSGANPREFVDFIKDFGGDVFVNIKYI